MPVVALVWLVARMVALRWSPLLAAISPLLLFLFYARFGLPLVMEGEPHVRLDNLATLGLAITSACIAAFALSFAVAAAGRRAFGLGCIDIQEVGEFAVTNPPLKGEVAAPPRRRRRGGGPPPLSGEDC